MSTPDFLALYVKDLPKSTDFYKKLFGLDPAAQRPGFTVFALPNGFMFSLWLTGTVEPEAEITGGGAEYGIKIDDEAALRASYESSKSGGLTVIQTPTQMNFGLTYVVEDPDRHRIRYYVPAAA